MIQIPFQDTNVSGLMKDYLSQKDNLKSFYGKFPTKENYFSQAKEKLRNYSHRAVLSSVLSQQMGSLELYAKQEKNIELLKLNNTVTVTTGHQLNLLSGPLYFIYKILHTVKICDELNASQSEINFAPIYWMATEDHDFDEINHFNLYENSFSYTAKSGGYVGDISSEFTEDTLTKFIQGLGDNKFEIRLKEIVQSAYFQKLSLAEATRVLVHELLGEFGILILDADNSDLKKLMIPYFEKELVENNTQRIVQETNERLNKSQAYVREINLFYLNNGIRERIEKTENGFTLVESGKAFNKEEILFELNQYPEKFSPNVILRPFYQEVILPNVAYVGGGGEIAYWLQLKANFELNNVPFPMLVLRNSMLIIPNAIKHKAEKVDLLSAQMFEPLHTLRNNYVEEKSELFNELKALENDLKTKFDALENISNRTTASFSQMVKAQKQKQLNGYKNLHQRLLKAEQERHEVQIRQIEEVKSYIFPKNNWQERVINFSYFYQNNGSALFQKIYEAMPTFDSAFNILALDSIAKK